MNSYRSVWLVAGILAFSLALPVLCLAAVTGFCANCHTMHNSEQGLAVAFTRDSTGQKVSRQSAFPMLLKTDCVGCHSHPSAETIVNIGDSRVPVVFNLSAPTYPANGSSTSALAGGNYYWMIQGGDAYGHNVHGISAADGRFSASLAPGGVSRQQQGCTDCHGTLATPQSGCLGCHDPQHHANGSGVIAGREEGWYRFLGSVMQRDEEVGPSAQGVVGIEAVDWEQNPAGSRHNTYQGRTGGVPYVSYLESGAINQKCAGCHGRYHSESIADATWIRHPVDVAIPDAGEYADFINYDPLVPVARPGVTGQDAGFFQINHGLDQVACISCHRAHGSPYPAMLRWAYRDWPGNDVRTGLPAVNGCAVCHTTKN
jgi:hypothetical protein